MAHRVRRLRATGLALAAGLCLAVAPADAAGRVTQSHHGRPAKAKPVKAVKAEPATEEKATERVTPAGVWTSGEGERACYKGRRKLWQDGQGWVVKRVAVCP
ncbi:hypothetical protein [Methylobacterium brachythecii]|uniref:Secreted protein n=1 Tax=Methylobacterium brachythecii TaxID=1176177 RepID=A0A7W6F5J5_9HYPH|nr:hypothetical protein [Methylobacterium brachythecii]MBB3901324.1 hypothetical protein [Methylobacterium brachythecii]GLS42898.1 hypothetical protein GCM10007884_08830 [Methylobacterium brachythecii]